MYYLPTDVMYIINNYKIKNNYNKVLNEIKENKLDIPCGDFGLLRRSAKQNIIFYGNDLLQCVENYIEHMNNSSFSEKEYYISELQKYTIKSMNCEIYNFPNVEWLYHPVHGDYHSGGSYAFCNAIIRQYYLYPDIFKDTWIEWLNKYC